MNLTDILALSLRNLRQAKLRTLLTVMGVIIGVAAIITMVSFGLGLQQNIIQKTFARLDVFTSITVFGRSADSLIALNERRQSADPPDDNANQGRVLDDAAIAEIAHISGVKYAQPVINFQCYVRLDERTRRLRIGGALPQPEANPRFRQFLAGGVFTGDDTNEIIVTEGFQSLFTANRNNTRRTRPDRTGEPKRRPVIAGSSESDEVRQTKARELLGQEVVLLTLPQRNDGADSVFGIPLFDLPGAASAEADAGDDRTGLEQHRFRIVGVLPRDTAINLNNMIGGADIFIPLEQARRFRESNRDPLEQVGAALAGDTGYPRAEVRVSDPTLVPAVQKAITDLGFNSFSLNNQVDEIRRVFLIVNGGLALIGGIALLVASLGIANTMIMSILERTREIGIMKAIGGSDGEIMRIFFFEASLIGLLGGSFGVLLGWVVDRVANFAVNRWMMEQNEHIEFFSIPWYLWGSAILFAIAISLLAATWPAFRAARVDPVRALRHD